MPNEGDLTETARAEAERLISRYFAWKARAGRSLSDSSRARYRPVLLSLADERGSLLNVTVNDLLDFQDSRRHLSDSTRGHDRVVLRGFFRFARQEGLRSDNPAEALVAPATRRKRMPMRRWVSAPRRDALPKAYRPIFDFLREVWGRHPELSFQDVLTIRSPGGVPEVVEVRSGRKRGQLVTLSPGARRALTEMGGSIPVTKGAIERVFRDSYQRAFSPTDLKRIPPVGFGVDLHESLEGEVRELLTAGRMEDAARRAFVEVEARIARLVRSTTGRDDLYTRNLVDHAFAEGGPLAAAIPARQRESFRMLLSGALGMFRNPVAHQASVFPDDAYGLEVVLVADLALRLLDPIETRLTAATPPVALQRPKRMTEKTLRNLSPSEFERWALLAIGATPSPPEAQQLGIDGFTVDGAHPVQVKRRDNIQRDVVDGFETAIGRQGADRGFLVAFSFTRGAKEEATRSTATGRGIELVTTAELLAGLRRR